MPCSSSTYVPGFDGGENSTLFRGQLLFRLPRFLLLHSSIRPATVGPRFRSRSGSYGSSLSLGLSESRSSHLPYLVKQGTHSRCRHVLVFIPFVIDERTAGWQRRYEQNRVAPRSHSQTRCLTLTRRKSGDTALIDKRCLGSVFQDCKEFHVLYTFKNGG